MGQAIVDLPDPGEVPAAPVSSADDLLSQMAGDEIDRLLAEADQEKDAPASETTSVAQEDPEKPITGAQIDELFKTIDTNQSSAATETSTPTAATASPSPAPTEPPAPPTIDTAPLDLKDKARQLDDAIAKDADDALPQAKAIESETSSVEKNALATAIDSLEPPRETPIEEDGTAPFYLKPLVWLNLPMELLPLEAREVLGKVALLTLANAVAVLGYVLLFRRHH